MNIEYETVRIMRHQVQTAFALTQSRSHLARLVMPVGFLLVSLDIWLRDYRYGIQSNKEGVAIMVRSVLYLEVINILERRHEYEQAS
jgi:hypothetical protein